MRGCLLETTAQIFRLLNKGEFSRGIQESLEQFDTVGTSHFVQMEFENVACKLYDDVAAAFDSIPDQNRPHTFSELWVLIANLLPVYLPGGGKLLSIFSATLASSFGSQLVTPRTVSNYVRAERLILYESFFLVGQLDVREMKQVFDCSSCCAWTAQICKGEPGPLCRLKMLCTEGRDRFLESVETMAAAGRHESKWLREHLIELRGLGPMEMMTAIAKKPNNFGDLLIFWETPANWCILTADKSFELLRVAHRSDIDVWRIRLPRAVVAEACELRLEGSPEIIPGTLENYSLRGAGVRSRQVVGKKGDLIHIQSATLGRRLSEIVREGPGDLFYGLRFKPKPGG